MATHPRSSAPDAAPLAAALRGAFAQPDGQALPRDFLELLVALDRAKRGGADR